MSWDDDVARQVPGMRVFSLILASGGVPFDVKYSRGALHKDTRDDT